MSVIQVGDLVQIRVSDVVPLSLRSSNAIYKVETIPDNSPAGNKFWELSHEGALFVIDSSIILVLVNATLPV